MRHPHRLTITVPAAARDAANQLMMDLFAGDEAQRETFSVELNADGGEGAATHFACCVQFTDAQLAFFKREAKARRIPFDWQRSKADDGDLMETSKGAVRPDKQGKRRRVEPSAALEEMGVRPRREKMRDAQVLVGPRSDRSANV